MILATCVLTGWLTCGSQSRRVVEELHNLTNIAPVSDSFPLWKEEVTRACVSGYYDGFRHLLTSSASSAPRKTLTQRAVPHCHSILAPTLRALSTGGSPSQQMLPDARSSVGRCWKWRKLETSEIERKPYWENWGAGGGGGGNSSDSEDRKDSTPRHPGGPLRQMPKYHLVDDDLQNTADQRGSEKSQGPYSFCHPTVRRCAQGRSSPPEGTA